MHEPDYSDYTLAQLYDCLEHVNSQLYPERFERIHSEIRLRTEMGETLSDPFLDELVPTSVPMTLALAAWWSFIWRYAVVNLILGVILFAVNRLNIFLELFPEYLMQGVLVAVWAFTTLLIGPFIMSQVLAKRYSRYRIRIVRLRN